MLSGRRTVCRVLLAVLCGLVPIRANFAQSPRVIVIDPGHGGDHDAGTDAIARELIAQATR